MSTMIQIRHVPDDIHRTLKSRAARAGMSLSDYLLRELTAVARRPELDELLERIARRPAGRVSEGSAEAVRAERETRR
jgi:antitoxin FitA